MRTAHGTCNLSAAGGAADDLSETDSVTVCPDISGLYTVCSFGLYDISGYIYIHRKSVFCIGRNSGGVGLGVLPERTGDSDLFGDRGGLSYRNADDPLMVAWDEPCRNGNKDEGEEL